MSTQVVEICVEGGRIVQGHARMQAALEMRQPIVANIDGESFTVMPLSKNGDTFNLVQFGGGVVDVLPLVEATRCFLEGVDAYKAGKQFHEGTYAKSGSNVPDDEYQRGLEWRRGWNEAASGRA